MPPGRHGSCCVRTTVMLLMSVVWCLWWPENARGQVVVTEAAPVKDVMPDASAPSEKAAADALVRVEDWLRAGEVPEGPQKAGADAKGSPEFPGVSLWVRAQGRVIARASLMTPPGERIPDVQERVVRGVLDQVGRSFDAARFPGVERKEWVRAVLGGATLTLEVSGPLVPFRADTYDEVDLGVSPGVWGVATSVGGVGAAGQGFDAIFPLNMLSSGMMPGAGLRSTIARATNDPSLPLPGVAAGSPGAIAKSHDARYYRFRTRQVTRFSPGVPPTVLVRGGVLVRKTGLTQAGLREFADRLATHLLDRLDVRPAGEGEAVGVLELRDVGAHAADAAQRGPALVALHALSVFERAAGEGGDGGVMTRVHATTRTGSDVLVAELRRRMAEKEEPPSAIEAALMASWLGGRDEVVKDPATGEVAALLARAVLSTYDPAKDEFDAKLPEPVRGLVALALVRLSGWEGSGVVRDGATKCVRRAFLAVTPGHLEAQMPWLGWAELELAGEGGKVPSEIALAEVRDDLYSRVVGTFDAGEDDPDMAGGILGLAGSALPAWHTARPGAFLATMLADERLTARENRVRELARLLDVVRFVRQLAVDGSVLPLYGDRTAGVLWGVRSALFDLREPGDATSFSLMMMAETLRALELGTGEKPEAP